MNRSEIKKIGGSDVAAILGLSPWKSAHSLYLHLIGELPPKDDNEILERGRDLEPVICDIFRANHKDEFDATISCYITHEDYDFIIGSPDALLIKPCPENEAWQDPKPVSGLEIKTADITKMSQWGEEGTDEIPVEYLVQCQWYCGLLGVLDWYIAVGFVKPGSRKICSYREYRIEHDPARYEAMVKCAVDFWENHVEKRIPPEITEPDTATVEYYKKRYPKHEPEKWSYSDESLDCVAKDFLAAQEESKACEKNLELLKTKLIAAIGENEGIITASGRFSYRASKPSLKTDWKSVAEVAGASQDMIEKFTSEQSGFRRLLAPKTKGGKE